MSVGAETIAVCRLSWPMRVYDVCVCVYLLFQLEDVTSAAQLTATVESQNLKLIGQHCDSNAMEYTFIYSRKRKTKINSK